MVSPHTFVSKLTASQRSFTGILEVNLANDVDDDLSFPGAHLGAIDDLVDHALVLSLGFEAMSLFELAILCILYHGCLWFVFDQGNPTGFPESQTPTFTLHTPILAGADTCPNRKSRSKVSKATWSPLWTGKKAAKGSVVNTN